MELAAGALIVAVAVFVLACAAYVAASYALAPPHPRLRAKIAEAARELLWALLVQPLFPLYYVVGRRMGPAPHPTPGATPVVLVHGYFQNRGGFVLLARHLGRGGVGPLYGFNYLWLRGVSASASRLRRFVETVCIESGCDRVDLVCHSMGGLVAFEYLHAQGGVERVRRCVTIATPFQGVSFRGPIPGAAGRDLRRGSATVRSGATALAVPSLSIFSSFDNVVHPPSTSSLSACAGRDHVAGTMGHLAILCDRSVATAVGEFLNAEPPT